MVVTSSPFSRTAVVRRFSQPSSFPSSSLTPAQLASPVRLSSRGASGGGASVAATAPSGPAGITKTVVIGGKSFTLGGSPAEVARRESELRAQEVARQADIARTKVVRAAEAVKAGVKTGVTESPFSRTAAVRKFEKPATLKPTLSPAAQRFAKSAPGIISFGAADKPAIVTKKETVTAQITPEQSKEQKQAELKIAQFLAEKKRIEAEAEKLRRLAFIGAPSPFLRKSFTKLLSDSKELNEDITEFNQSQKEKQLVSESERGRFPEKLERFPLVPVEQLDEFISQERAAGGGAPSGGGGAGLGTVPIISPPKTGGPPAAFTTGLISPTPSPDVEQDVQILAGREFFPEKAPTVIKPDVLSIPSAISPIQDVRATTGRDLLLAPKGVGAKAIGARDVPLAPILGFFPVLGEGLTEIAGLTGEVATGTAFEPTASLAGLTGEKREFARQQAVGTGRFLSQVGLAISSPVGAVTVGLGTVREDPTKAALIVGTGGLLGGGFKAVGVVSKVGIKALGPLSKGTGIFAKGAGIGAGTLGFFSKASKFGVPGAFVALSAPAGFEFGQKLKAGEFKEAKAFSRDVAGGFALFGIGAGLGEAGVTRVGVPAVKLGLTTTRTAKGLVGESFGGIAEVGRLTAKDVAGIPAIRASAKALTPIAKPIRTVSRRGTLALKELKTEFGEAALATRRLADPLKLETRRTLKDVKIFGKKTFVAPVVGGLAAAKGFGITTAKSIPELITGKAAKGRREFAADIFRFDIKTKVAEGKVSVVEARRQRKLESLERKREDFALAKEVERLGITKPKEIEIIKAQRRLIKLQQLADVGLPTIERTVSSPTKDFFIEVGRTRNLERLARERTKAQKKRDAELESLFPRKRETAKELSEIDRILIRETRREGLAKVAKRKLKVSEKDISIAPELKNLAEFNRAIEQEARLGSARKSIKKRREEIRIETSRRIEAERLFKKSFEGVAPEKRKFTPFDFKEPKTKKPKFKPTEFERISKEGTIQLTAVREKPRLKKKRRTTQEQVSARQERVVTQIGAIQEVPQERGFFFFAPPIVTAGQRSIQRATEIPTQVFGITPRAGVAPRLAAPIATRLAAPTSPRLAAPTITEFATAVTPRLAAPSAPRLRTPTITRLATPTITQQFTPTRPILRTPTREKPPTEGLLLFPPFPKQLRARTKAKRKKAGPAYDVLVKAKGKFKKARKKPLPRNLALAQGALIADKTTSRTFKIKKSKKKTKLRDSRQPTLRKFRKGKRKDTFIEKTAFAIDSRGERAGIPFKGLATLRQNPELRISKKKRRAKRKAGLIDLAF